MKLRNRHTAQGQMLSNQTKHANTIISSPSSGAADNEKANAPSDNAYIHEQTKKHSICHHCGEAASSHNITEDGHIFCCEGCKTVYQILRDNNLCAYYELNSHAGVSLRHAVENIAHRSRFDYLEDASVQAHLLEFHSNHMNRVSFYLPQIHCTSCLWLLEKLYTIESGIISSRVDFMHKRLSLVYHPEHVSLRRIVELLTTLGYEPELRLKDFPLSAQGQQDSSSSQAQEARLLQTKKQNVTMHQYLKIGIAGFAFANTMILSFPEYLSSQEELSPALRSFFGILSIVLSLPVLVYSASEFFRSSFLSLKQRHINLDVPIVLGIVALFARSVVEIANGSTSGYLDSFTGLVFLLLIGRLLQKKTFDTIAFDRDYTSYFPIAVCVKREGRETTIPLANVQKGEHIIIRNKELIPTDSVLLSPFGHIDYSFVTGESAPVEVVEGEMVYAGGRAIGRTLELLCAKEVSQSYLRSLWNNESLQKHEKTLYETVADRFGAYFTAAVIVLAGAAFVLWLPDIHTALNAATAVLIIACPCAMTLAAPFALGWTQKIFARAGFYLKNGSVALDLTSIDTIVFDKTGTLTQSNNNRVYYQGNPLKAEEQDLLAVILQHSTHPLARSIAATFAYIELPVSHTIDEIVEIPARGIRCIADGHLFCIGSEAFLQEQHSEMKNNKGAGHQGSTLFCSELRRLSMQQTVLGRNGFGASGASVHISIDGTYKGFFVIEHRYRQGLQAMFDALAQKFILHMLSGDNDKERRLLNKFFPNPHTMHFYQSPFDKLDAVRALQEQGHHRVMMVGDGLNDAGALQQSDVGIALSEGTAVFTPACDAVLQAGQLHRLHDFIRFAASTKNIIITAFWISIVYNTIGLTCACMGLLSPLFSAVLMPISNITVIGFSVGAVQLLAWRRNFTFSPQENL